MIHYHGTPISGSAMDAVSALTGRHALIPHAHPSNLETAMAVCKSFVLDNSAYSYWKQGGEVDWIEYTKWVSDISTHPGFTWCIIPDSIDGREQDNVDLVSRWAKSGFKFQGVPVYHMHESLEYLDDLVSNWQTVALGSSGIYDPPGVKIWWQRMGEMMTVICDCNGRPRCKLHGLRMLDTEIFKRLPLSSADSVNAGRHGGDRSRFGMYPPKTAGQRAAIIADRIEAEQSISSWAEVHPQEIYLDMSDVQEKG